VVVGPKGCGKSTLIRSLVKYYTGQALSDVLGPVTVVCGKKKRVTFFECPADDLCAMLDLGTWVRWCRFAATGAVWFGGLGGLAGFVSIISNQCGDASVGSGGWLVLHDSVHHQYVPRLVCLAQP